MKPRLTWRLAPRERGVEQRSRFLRHGDLKLAWVRFYEPYRRWFWAVPSNETLGIQHRNSFADGILYLSMDDACIAAKEYVVKCMQEKAP